MTSLAAFATVFAIAWKHMGASTTDGETMERKLAEQLIKHFLALDKPLNEAGQLVETIDDAALQRKMKGAIADVVLSVYTDLIRPIVREYPDLDPKDGRS
jgi:hypothetical protein